MFVLSSVEYCASKSDLVKLNIHIHKFDFYLSHSYSQGRLHKGEWCEMHHGENWGGDVVMIMMLLIVSIIIYYYMNTFITLHQCTFNLLFAFFVSKNIPDVFSYNSRKHCRIYFHNIWQKYY